MCILGLFGRTNLNLITTSSNFRKVTVAQGSTRINCPFQYMTSALLVGEEMSPEEYKYLISCHRDSYTVK